MVVGATGHAEVTGTDVPFQHGIIAGAGVVSAGTTGAIHDEVAVKVHPFAAHSEAVSAAAGVALMTTGTTRTMLRPRTIDARVAILRILLHP